jgi:hypothetical protein
VRRSYTHLPNGGVYQLPTKWNDEELSGILERLLEGTCRRRKSATSSSAGRGRTSLAVYLESTLIPSSSYDLLNLLDQLVREGRGGSKGEA